MAQSSNLSHDAWTAVDLALHFGPVPLSRVRATPGFASEHDVIEIHDREKRLFELYDGILMEKTVGTYESYLAGLLLQLLGEHVRKQDLGILLTADGMVRLAPGVVRIPDVSFISWSRLPGRKIPRDPIGDIVPDLAVEVISRGNTPEEMQQKLKDYFAAKVRQAWYVYPDAQEIHLYASVEAYRKYAAKSNDVLDADDLLPGFRLSLHDYFADPS